MCAGFSEVRKGLGASAETGGQVEAREYLLRRQQKHSG